MLKEIYFATIIFITFSTTVLSQPNLNINKALEDDLISVFDHNRDRILDKHEIKAIKQIHIEVNDSIYGLENLRNLNSVSIVIGDNANIDNVLKLEKLEKLKITHKKYQEIFEINVDINLPSINDLTLFNCKINKSIYLSINPTIVEFTNCELNSQIKPLLTNPNIEELKLENCNLESMDYIYSPSNKLRKLNLRNNKISDDLIVLKDLRNLEYLDLSKNNISKFSAEDNIFPQLKVFYLSENNFPEFPLIITKFTNLESLDISNKDKKISYKLTPELANLTNLKKLPFSITANDDIGFYLSKFPKLESLQLSGQNINKVPKEVFKLTELKYLSMSYTKLKILPKGLSKLTKLEHLSVKNNLLNEIKIDFSRLTQLKTLHLTNNQFESIPKSLNKAASLEMLYLQNNNIREANRDFTQLKKLKGIELSNNKIASFPFLLGKSTSLENLRLDRNNISSIDGIREGLFVNIKSIGLSNNNIESLPKELSFCENLESVYLDHNPTKSKFVYSYNKRYDYRRNILFYIFSKETTATVVSGNFIQTNNRTSTTRYSQLAVKKYHNMIESRDTIKIQHNYKRDTIKEYLLIGYPSRNDYYRVNFDDYGISGEIQNIYSDSIIEFNNSTKAKYILDELDKFKSIKHTGPIKIALKNQLLVTGKMSHGLPNGKWKTYYHSSTGEKFIQSEIEFKNGKFHGDFYNYEVINGSNQLLNKQIYKEGILVSDTELSNGRNYPSTTTQYINDTLLERKTLSIINKHNDTSYLSNHIYFIEDLNDQDLINFKIPEIYDGKFIGAGLGVNSDLSGIFKMGKMCGEWIKTNRLTLDTFVYSSIDEVKDSSLFLTYHFGGQLHVKGEIINNKREGEWFVYNEGGEVILHNNYLNNKLTGNCFSKQSEILTYSFNFQDGVPHGKCISSNEENYNIKNYSKGIDDGHFVSLRKLDNEIWVDSTFYKNGEVEGRKVKLVYPISASYNDITLEVLLTILTNEIPTKKDVYYKKGTINHGPFEIYKSGELIQKGTYDLGRLRTHQIKDNRNDK